MEGKRHEADKHQMRCQNSLIKSEMLTEYKSDYNSSLEKPLYTCSV